MSQLRLAPSGPLIEGINDGDVLIWSAAQREWLPGPGGGGVTEYDFIIQTLADFPNPPAGGFIDLVSGSYAIKAGVDLAGNTLRTQFGVNVLIKGLGGFGEKLLSTNSAGPVLLLDNGTTARIETLNLSNTGSGDCIEIQQAALASSRCSFNGGTGGTSRGVYLTNAGAWRDFGSSSFGGVDGLHVDDGDVELVSTRLLGGDNRALHVEAAADQIRLIGCFMQSSSDVAVLLNTPGADVFFDNCEINSLVANTLACIHVLEASTIQFLGGKWRTQLASRGNGLNIDGDVPGGIQVIGVHGEDISTSDASGEAFIKYTSGTVNRCTVQACNTASTVATAINWPAASVPAAGLLIVGNTFNDPTPFVGFVATDARVNAKANANSTGLMTETPIVP